MNIWLCKILYKHFPFLLIKCIFFCNSLSALQLLVHYKLKFFGVQMYFQRLIMPNSQTSTLMITVEGGR